MYIKKKKSKTKFKMKKGALGDPLGAILGRFWIPSWGQKCDKTNGKRNVSDKITFLKMMQF